jgi:uncharacterized protein involved in exopolysaccharide biosynthesis
MNEPVVDLTDVGSRIRRGWIRIVAVGALGGLIALAYTAWVQPIYQSDAAILVPEMQSMPGQLAAIGIPQAANGVGVLSGVLQSYSTTSFVAKSLNVKVREVTDFLTITSDAQTGQVRISARHTNADTARKAVALAIQHTTELDRSVGLSLASRQAIELEKSVKTRTAAMAKSEAALLEYQRSARTYSATPDDVGGSSYLKRLQELDLELRQVSSEIEAMRSTATRGASTSSSLPSGRTQSQELRNKLLEAESEFNQAKRKFTPQAPEYRDAKQKVDSLRQAFEDEARRYAQSIARGVDAKVAELEVRRIVLQNDIANARRLAERAPGEAMELTRLLRRVRTDQQLLQTVTAQYEQAKTDSQTSRVKWLVLDEPYVLEKPVNKNYKMNIALFGLLGLIAGTFMVTSSPRK